MLIEQAENANLGTVARAQTLAVLEGLDPNRKRILLQFLYESNLINVDKPIISLLGANLREANLQGAELQKAKLQKAKLQEANLQGAKLDEARLHGANLHGANLYRADLQWAKLQEAKLRAAKLRAANLRRAYLSGADLTYADMHGAQNLTQEQIKKANGDEHTKLPDQLPRPAHWKTWLSEEGEER